MKELICRMARENPTWGAPKIHGELLKLGFALSERSVSRYLRVVQRRGDPKKRWLALETVDRFQDRLDGDARTEICERCRELKRIVSSL